MNLSIHHGDSLRVVPGLGAFHAVVTDPPYSGGSTRKEWRSGGSVEAALYAAARQLAPEGLMVVASAASGRSIERIVSAVAPVVPFGRVLAWCKPHSRSRSAGPWGWQTVLWLVFGKMGGAFGAPDHIVADAAQYRRQGTTAHPAELPAVVCEWLVAGLRPRLSKGARVLDPFAGTGAIPRAFARAGYEAHGVEVQEQWVTLARAIATAEAGAAE